ncbi:peptidyl-tRNA hydrolase 2, mitochondrial isoform X1 [Lampetra fluviatilis]
MGPVTASGVTGMDVLTSPVTLSLLTGLGCGYCLCLLLRGRGARPGSATGGSSGHPSAEGAQGAGDSAEVMSEGGEWKLVLVVRSDLKMGKGKVAAQCAHAAVSAFRQAGARHADALRHWELGGQAKVVTRVPDEVGLAELLAHARALGLPVSLVRDAGRTQVAPGTCTVLGVGPGPAGAVDRVTGHLKLY